MHGNETIISSKNGVIHRFFYDHCFWSVDEGSPQYADQGVVYTRLAQPLLDWSFEGYNTCLFAYGQTGSGKSYWLVINIPYIPEGGAVCEAGLHSPSGNVLDD